MKTILFIIFILFINSSFACRSTDLVLNSINPVNGQEFELKIKAYVPKGDFDKQVIILPPIGGTTTLEARYAGKVCARGVPAYVFVNWTDDMERSVEDLSVHDRGTIRGLHAVEIFLKEKPLKTRILGTSLGGIYAGVATGKFDLIEKAVIIASGTNLSEIMADSTLPELVTLKNERFSYHGFSSAEEYAAAIKKELTIEAENFRDKFSDKKLLFFKTNADTVIRTKYQDQLMALFNPENITLIRTRFGHKKGIIVTYALRSNIVANFLAN